MMFNGLTQLYFAIRQRSGQAEARTLLNPTVEFGVFVVKYFKIRDREDAITSTRDAAATQKFASRLEPTGV